MISTTFPLHLIFRKERSPIVVKYHDQNIRMEQTQGSRVSPFPICIVLTLPQLIGTHEGTKKEGLEGIDFSQGWNGFPIAAATLNERLLDKLGEGIHVVEHIDYGDIGVLDGHHRREMAERSRLVYAVTQMFPLMHPKVLINTWLENFAPLTPQEVAQYFKQKGKVVKPKATKFQIQGNDGVLRRIAESQPHVRVPRHILEKHI